MIDQTIVELMKLIFAHCIFAIKAIEFFKFSISRNVGWLVVAAVWHWNWLDRTIGRFCGREYLLDPNSRATLWQQVPTYRSRVEPSFPSSTRLFAFFSSASIIQN